MKLINFKNVYNGNRIVHLNGDSSNYNISYDHGYLIYQNNTICYKIPDWNTKTISFPRKETLANKNKYDYLNVRNLYRDINPDSITLNNNTNLELNTGYSTNTITISGINDYIPINAESGTEIYVNNNLVPSGTLVDNGDNVSFKVISPNAFNSTKTTNISIGDVVKSFSLTTKGGKISSGLSKNPDVQYNNGTNYTWVNPTLTTKGQFSTTLWRLNTTGKVYFEIQRTLGNPAAWLCGIQSAPTRIGNYHMYDGAGYVFGNGATYTVINSFVSLTRDTVIIDIDNRSLYVNGILTGTLSGTGIIFFGISDITSYSTGAGKVYFDEKDFINPVPSDCKVWGTLL